MEEKEVGKVAHYYGKIGVAIIDVSDIIKVGDRIHFVGRSTDFEDTIESMEVEHERVMEAKVGEMIGLKVSQEVKEGDKVYKVSEE